jgi:hypothetical protein
LKINFNVSEPSVVRKQIIDLVVDLRINLNSFAGGPVPIPVDEFDDFLEDVTQVSNALRDDSIVVTSRGSVTSLKFGVSLCGPL